MKITNKKIKFVILQPEKHIDEIILNIDDVIHYILYEEMSIEPEMFITEISRVLSMRSVKLHLAHFKILKAQLSLVEAQIEPERHEAIKSLSNQVLKLFIASLKISLNYEKCASYCGISSLDLDESLLDEGLKYSLGCEEMEA